MANTVNAISAMKREKNISNADQEEFRTVSVNIPAKNSVDIEFSGITLTVSEGFISRSKYLSRK